MVKRYHAPVPPVARALSHPALVEEDKAGLKALGAAADPVVLLAEIRAAQADLGRRVDARGVGRGETPEPIDLGRFAASLKTAWKDGERRPIHRRRCIRRNPLPPRPSMLDAARDAILAWLGAEPDLSAAAVLGRLSAAHPERFRAGHLRTAQRFVAARRTAMARDLLLGRPALAPPPNDTASLGSIPT